MKQIRLFLIMLGVLTGITANAEVTLPEADTYGSLVGPDGSEWFYTQNFTMQSGDYQYYYKTSDITIFDNNLEKVMTIHYVVPDSVKTNTIQPFGEVTQKLFNIQETTYEVLVYVHTVGTTTSGSAIQQIHENHVFMGKKGGTAVDKDVFQCQNMAVLDASKGYDTHLKLCAADVQYDASLQPTTVTADVYTPVKYKTTAYLRPTLEHEFKLNFENVNYMEASWFNTYTIDGKFYYVLSYYEKPYASGYDENYEIIRTEDNNFIVEVYDETYNKVMNLKLSADPNPGTPYTMHTIGLWGNDLSKGYYTNDDQLNLVVGTQDYNVASDGNTYNFYVYNQKGEQVKTIIEGAQSWNFLSDLPGQESQVGFLMSDGTEETDSTEAGSVIKMVNLPSCTEEVTLSSVSNGHKKNWNFDRAAISKDDYQYAFGLNEGGMNRKTRELLGYIGWYDRKGNEVRVDSMGIGARGQMFKPLFNESYPISAYTYNTDNLIEYPYLAKVKRSAESENPNKVDNTLRIANQNGELLYNFAGTDSVPLKTAAFLNFKSTNPLMLIMYQNETTQKITFQVVNLPLKSFNAGGTGTKDDPYLISTPGELALIANKGEGNYKIVNDLDMSLLGKDYIPAQNFAGSLDGDGHAISNLIISGDDTDLGLLGSVVKSSDYSCEIKNITLNDPSITTGDYTQNAGFFVGWAHCTNIHDCFVNNGNIDGTSGNGVIGGIAGTQDTGSAISCCGVYNTTLNTACKKVGGILGEAKGGSPVSACAVTGCTIVGKNCVGGIMGENSQWQDWSPITNCHVSVSIKGENTVGGIIGYSNRSAIKNNYVELTDFACSPDNDNLYNAGGLIGYVETLYDSKGNASTTASETFVNNVINYVNADTNNTWADITGKKAWHRVIGFTAQDEADAAASDKECGLANNYVSAQLSANGEKTATTPDGADTSDFSKALFTNLNYGFGLTSDTPWKEENGKIGLYFEVLDPTAINEVQADGSMFNVQSDATYNLAGQHVSDSAKGLIIKNGRKVIKY